MVFISFAVIIIIIKVLFDVLLLFKRLFFSLSCEDWQYWYPSTPHPHPPAPAHVRTKLIWILIVIDLIRVYYINMTCFNRWQFGLYMPNAKGPRHTDIITDNV